MPMFCTLDGTDIYYKDWGAGRPVILSHGWPLNSDSWEAQQLFPPGHRRGCPRRVPWRLAENAAILS